MSQKPEFSAPPNPTQQVLQQIHALPREEQIKVSNLLSQELSPPKAEMKCSHHHTTPGTRCHTILAWLENNPGVYTALSIAKATVGPKATKKDVNPCLYYLHRSGTLIQMTIDHKWTK